MACIIISLNVVSQFKEWGDTPLCQVSKKQFRPFVSGGTLLCQLFSWGHLFLSTLCFVQFVFFHFFVFICCLSNSSENNDLTNTFFWIVSVLTVFQLLFFDLFDWSSTVWSLSGSSVPAFLLLEYHKSLSDHKSYSIGVS